MGCLSIDEPYHEARCVRVSKQKNVVLGYAYFYQKYRRSVSIGSYAESSCVHLILARLHLSHACFKMTRSDVHSIPKRTHLRHGLCPSQRVFIFRHAAQARTFISLFFCQKQKTMLQSPTHNTDVTARRSDQTRTQNHKKMQKQLGRLTSWPPPQTYV